MSKFIRDLFTESDNVTWDLGRCLGALAFLQYLGYGFYAYVFKGQTFDPQAAGIGLTTMMGGFGAMVLMKGKEQPATPVAK